MTPTRMDAYRLLHDGSVALAEVEAAGIRIDVGHCRGQMKSIEHQVGTLRNALFDTEQVKDWQRRYGTAFNINSTTQLATMLFEEWGHEPVRRTKNDKPSVDAKALAELDDPMVNKLLEIRTLTKLRSTYLQNILRETVGGFLHPFFNLGNVKTYRSSSNAINFQNLPIHDKMSGSVIRPCFIPRPGHRLLEVDYGGLEVRVGACYHRDPGMLRYINDPALDMHRDAACKCYKLPIDEITKAIRYQGKNGFVFPQFYGDYWKNCARAMWDTVDKQKLTTASGLSLRDHLTAVGMRRLRQFEDHIQTVESEFWDVQFPVYAKWKEKRYAEYLKRGWFDTLSGFRCSGVLGRNDVTNHPVQGTAFHCLLWSLTQLILQEQIHQRMRSRVVGQIHDSIVIDAHPDEFDDLLVVLERVMTKDILEHWDWIITPLVIEAEAGPVDGSWHTKKAVQM